MQSHCKSEEHGHEANGSLPSSSLLHEGDEGEEGLQGDLALQHAANDELQASECFVRQVAPYVQGPEIDAHASLALGAGQDIPHVPDWHRLQLVLW